MNYKVLVNLNLTAVVVKSEQIKTAFFLMTVATMIIIEECAEFSVNIMLPYSCTHCE